MPYIDLAGLSRYASRQKDRLERDCALLRDMQWLRTEKAGAVSLWPAGGTPLKPSVDFLFTETGPASGDKGPDNPSTITGVSSVKVTRAGKNLFVPADLVSQVGTTITIAGVTLTVLPDFAYSLTGTATADALFYLRYNGSNQGLPVKSDAIYTFSGCPSGGSASTYYMAWHPAIGGNVCDYGSSVTVVHPSTDATHYTFNCQIMVKAGTTVTNLVFKPQMELGSVKTEYEVPEVTDYPLPLGSTYYGGTLDAASGVMTVTWGSTVITGAEEWTRRSDSPSGLSTFNSGLGIPQNYMSNNPSASTRHCSHFVYSNTRSENTYTSWGIATNTLFTMSATDYPDATAFKTWLASEYSAGHPVTIFYKLNTPQTVQLSPTEILSLTQPDKYTPRLNTVYTDAQAVQAGYVKSPIRDEYELQQAVIAQGGNV